VALRELPREAPRLVHRWLSKRELELHNSRHRVKYHNSVRKVRISRKVLDYQGLHLESILREMFH